MQFRPHARSGMPELPKPRSLKIGVLAGLAVLYVALFWGLTRRAPVHHASGFTAIPVAVVKTARRTPPAPPIVVPLAAPQPVEIPPPTLVVR
ncbi:hypothetical protein AA13595_2978 [Gluconacetobacter johannae DSM 13595]|nr:hypothetical protein [Gluconacetobacter johannae]GBQ90761.1 hypothetical protein AA13595_2978 [Gluconacetobacter johannae DSM 13595]